MFLRLAVQMLLFFCLACPRPSIAESSENTGDGLTSYALCLNSDTIVSGKVVAVSNTELPDGSTFQFVTVQVDTVLKGIVRVPKTQLSIGDSEYLGRFIHLFIGPPVRSFTVDKPTYTVEEKRFFFLRDEFTKDLHLRTAWKVQPMEKPWTAERERLLYELVSSREKIDLLGDQKNCFDYSIPGSSTAVAVVLDEVDYSHGYSRIVEYYQDSEKVGERIWWDTGHLAYEVSLRKGKRHGVIYVWDKSGKPWQAMPYFEDLLHGPYRSWYKSGTISTSYWIHGGNVTKDAYIQRRSMIRNLPAIESLPEPPPNPPLKSEK